MKVRVRKIRNDVILARSIVNRLTKILTPQFDYIIESAPDVTFFMCDNSVDLSHIIFESLGGDDQIRVDEESVILELGNGMHQILFENEGFGDLLYVEEDDLYDLSPEIKKALEENREYYRQME